MLNIEAFTDRREAIALFEALRGYDPNKRWPLLPILAFIAPGGSGKSTLIEYLQKRCLSNGRPAVPYAYLDFTLTSTPGAGRAPPLRRLPAPALAPAWPGRSRHQ